MTGSLGIGLLAAKFKVVVLILRPTRSRPGQLVLPSCSRDNARSID